MAEYDGSIRINTKIDTKEASAQLMSLENRIVKTSEKIASLRSKMDTLKDAKIPTQEYKAIETDIAKAEKELEKLIEKQAQMQNAGKNSGASWDTLNRKIQASKDYIDTAKEEMQELVNAGKAFTLGRDTERFDKLSQQLRYAEDSLSVMTQRHDELITKQVSVSDRYKKLGQIAKSVFSKISSLIKGAGTGIKRFGYFAKNAFSNLIKSAKKSSKTLSTIGYQFKSFALYMLIFNQISKAFNAMTTGVKEGFQNLYNENDRFKNSVDSLKASALTLKNSFAAAFRPLVEMAIPYIQRTIDALASLMNIIGQLTAAITGQKTYTKAIKQTTAAIEDQNKAQNKQLSSLDKLNNLSSVGAGGTDGGATDMFEEVPIEDKWKDMSDRLKKIGEDFFKPFKKAWNKEGRFVMNSWKHALDEIKKLIKDIGRDFLEVWQQDKTVSMFEDILHIVGDIGLVVGNLAKNFREAWNTNDVGLHIFENIRDILAVIIHNIRLAADYTVEWSKTLDFYPLLSKIEEWTKSLVAVFDTLSGVVTDFYTMVLLPLGKWTLEKGLPKLLQVFIDFNNKVDWEALRSNLADFWKHLEPFAEKVGEGLILFIRDASDALAGFLNSQQFKDFLEAVEDWMDKVTPRDVADGLEKLAKAIVLIKLALIGFKAVASAAKGIEIAKSFFSLWKGGKGAAIAGEMEAAAGGISGISGALAMLASNAALAAGAAGVAMAAFEPFKKFTTDFDNNAETRFYEEYKGISGTLNLFKDSFNDFSNDISTFENAMETVNEGVILTDEQMQKLSQSTEFCNDDIESLTEGMIDLHPELEGIREEFGLWDAYPETLSDIAQGVGLIKDGTVDAGYAFEEFRKPMWNMTEDALAFFEQIQNGTISLTGAHSSMKEQVAINNSEIIASNDSVELDLSDHTAEWTTDMQVITDEHGNMVLDVTQGSDSLRDTFNRNNTEINTSNDGMAQNFSENSDNITGKITDIEGSLNESKGIFSSWAESIGNSLKNAWESAKKWIGSIIDKVGELMSSIGSVKSGGFSNGKSITSYRTVTTYSAMPQMAALSKMEFPGYATGQVIPTSMKKHLAWLGDNKRETEVVSPLSTIEKAVENAMLRVGSMGGGKITLEVPVYLNNREIARSVQEYDLEMFNKRGIGLFEH